MGGKCNWFAWNEIIKCIPEPWFEHRTLLFPSQWIRKNEKEIKMRKPLDVQMQRTDLKEDYKQQNNNKNPT